MKKFVSSVQIAVPPEEPIDRTSPQKIAPRGFYSESVRMNQSMNEDSVMNDLKALRSEISMRVNPHNGALGESTENSVGSIFMKQRNMRTPELPKVGTFQASAGRQSLPDVSNPYG